MSGGDYFKEAVKVLPKNIKEAGRKLDFKSHSVMRTGYCSDLDGFTTLNENQANSYQNVIGLLRCSVELVHIDRYAEATLISCSLDQPLKVHLDQDHCIFSYHKHYSHSNIMFESNIVVWNDNQFNKDYWK